MPNPVIDREPNRRWQNWHVTHDVGGRVAQFFTPHNIFDDGSSVPGKPFAAGLAALQVIVREAEANQMRVRALGSGWSLSSVAFVDEYLVNTSRLSSWFVGFKTPDLYVEAQAREAATRLVFAQCGVQIKTLNAFLEGKGLALPTTGASNGQTLVGAMSTGTHGSARDVGAVQDYILGIHLVGEEGRHYWLERPGKPTMTAAFADWLGAELVRDEDLFLSALVSFGSFGLIHAVMFEAEPLYLLDRYILQRDHGDVLTSAFAGAPGALALPAGEVPFHFEVVFNPYLREAGQKGAFVRAMYKRALAGPPPPAVPTGNSTIVSPDLVSLAAHVTDTVPGLVPGLLQKVLVDGFEPQGPFPVRGAPGVQFGDSQPTNGGTSLEIGVPLDRVQTTLDVLFGVTAQHVFGAPFALRYVRASDALLAFTCHAPTTCTIENPRHRLHTRTRGARRDFPGVGGGGHPGDVPLGTAGPARPG